MQTTATVRSGRLQGEAGDGVVVFRAVPFARVRAGEGRLRRAEPVSPWSGTREARVRGPAAPQRAGLPRWLHRYSAVPRAGWDEDCLHADVFTPGCDGGRRPVLVFVHGGGFTHGAGGFFVYDGRWLAARGDVVVVAIQYRLGAFGNLDPTSLGDAEAEANVGLRDQIAALRFVRDEIEAFGGDPDRVTVFGQSAGAMSLGALLAAPAARGLFHRAILQSGAARNVHAAPDAARVIERLLVELGHDGGGARAVAALRAAPADALLRAQAAVSARLGLPLGMLAFQPSVDGDLLPTAPEVAMAGPGFADVPLLIGTNRDEWKMFTATDARRRRLDAPTLEGYVARTLERDGVADRVAVAEVLEAWGVDPETGRRRSPAAVWAAFQTDRVFTRPAVALAEARAAAGTPTWLYRFDRPPAVLRDRVGACHALELPFVFGTLRAPALRAAFAWPADALAVSRAMQDAWIAFARDGDPTVDAGAAGGGAPAWPRVTPTGARARVFGGDAPLAEALAPAVRRIASRLSRSARSAPTASTPAAPA